MIKSLMKSAVRSRMLARRFSATANQSDAKESQDQNAEQNQQEGEEFDYDDYQEQQGTSIFRKIFRVVSGAAFTMLALNGYYLYTDEGNLDISSKRLGYMSFFYNFPLFVRTKTNEAYDFLLKPPVTKFLPGQPPLRPNMLNKTLVLNFEGTLYSKDFEPGQGIVLHLRPGFQKFIDEMSKLYEIVIYSEEDSQFLTEATMTIDPFQKYFTWVFGREFLVLSGAKHVKDLSLLNRDLRKVVVVDFDKDIYKEEPENLILLSKYQGEESEDSLRYLGVFLNHLANPNVKDVRREIKKYGGLDSLETFKKEVQDRATKLRKSQRYFTGGDKKKN
jgi:import inner membrane translocase subunit TIM50